MAHSWATFLANLNEFYYQNPPQVRLFIHTSPLPSALSSALSAMVRLTHCTKWQPRKKFCWRLIMFSQISCYERVIKMNNRARNYINYMITNIGLNGKFHLIRKLTSRPVHFICWIKFKISCLKKTRNGLRFSMERTCSCGRSLFYLPPVLTSPVQAPSHNFSLTRYWVR